MVTFWTAKIGYFFETEKRNDNFFCFNLFFIIKLPFSLLPCFCKLYFTKRCLKG